MNREIKFRAWNKKQNEWANINQLSDWGSCEITAAVGMGNEQYPYQTMRIVSDDVYELMQYTGLKDKNGKEIYEGDIVRYDESEKINRWVSGEKAVVIWMPPRFTFRVKPYDKFVGSNQNLPSVDDQEFIEIIGNIYENPELLTK